MADSRASIVFAVFLLAGIGVRGAEGRVTGPQAAAPGGQPAAQRASREAPFFAAKRLVFEGRWDGVRQGMERYLRDDPSGSMRDEARYWLARSLDAIAWSQPDVGGLTALERAAIGTLERLLHDAPAGPWSDDARDLRLRITGLLAVLGESVPENLVPDAASLSSLKSAALDVAAGFRPAVALAVLDRTVRSDPDPAVRSKAIALAGLTLLDAAMPMLEHAARYDADLGVRELARGALSRLGPPGQHVALAYSCFEARVTERDMESRLPTGKVATFPVPDQGGTTAGDARRTVERLFGRGLVFGENHAEAYDAVNPFATEAMLRILSRSSQAMHAIGSFVLGLVPGSVQRTADRVAGEARFDAMVVPFQLDRKSGVVLAARRGDRVALMYLRTVPRRPAVPMVSRAPSRGAAPRPTAVTGYCRTDRLEDGIVVRSTRCSVPVDGARVVDYGQAVAEIPAGSGTWTLTGQLVAMPSEHLIIGRTATLRRPDGALAAAADEIAVPFGNPSSFTVRGPKDGEAPRK